jgi:hypothetical protein
MALSTSPIPSGHDVRDIRDWLSDLAKRVGRLEVRNTGGRSQPFHGHPSTGWPGGDGTKLVPVKLNIKVNDTTYTGHVYENGRHQAATEENATIRVAAIAPDETLPTSGDYSWFQAWQEYWVSGGDDVLMWTIQPEIFR